MENTGFFIALESRPRPNGKAIRLMRKRETDFLF